MGSHVRSGPQARLSDAGAPQWSKVSPESSCAQSDSGQKRYKSTLLSGNGHSSSSAQPGASAATSSQAVRLTCPLSFARHCSCPVLQQLQHTLLPQRRLPHAEVDCSILGSLLQQTEGQSSVPLCS